MNILLICSSDYMAIPAAQKLREAGLLSAIAMPLQYKDRLLPSFLQSGFDHTTIHTVTKKGLTEELLELMQQYHIDCAFTITFPWILSQKVLDFPPAGCINFHPGLLPTYRGADPIFWQLKNRETHSGLSVHKMTSRIDEGPMLLVQQMQLIPGETYGMHYQRMGILAAEIVLQVAEIVQQNQPEAAAVTGDAPFMRKPDRKQVTINWQQQTAEEIEALVNAANPKYNGALTTLRQKEFSILEVGFADLNNPPAGVPPGTIVYADALYGPIVACLNNRFLRINTVCLQEGYLSGSKLFSMGLQPGEVFN
jgi:methionyl-tRNA formyltransferase